MFSTSGKIGELLASQLIQSGIQENYPIRYETLSQKPPKRGSFANFLEDEQEKSLLTETISKLKQSIKDNKPNILLLLGTDALQTFNPGADITKWRGHIFWSDECNCKCIATYHPGHAIRQLYWEKKEYPGRYRALFSNDITKAAEAASSRELGFKNHELIAEPTFAQTEEYLLTALKEAKLLSFDIECLPVDIKRKISMADKYAGHFVDCIGLAYELDRSICISFYYPEAGQIIRRWNEDQMIRLFGLVKLILESDIPKVAQNGQFDILVLWEFYDIKVRNVVWDTMIAAHNIYCELPKDLGTLISLYANLPYMKYLFTTNPLERWPYCAMDALANLHIMQGEIKEMKEIGILEHYRTITQPALLPLIHMQKEGVLIDKEFHKRALQRELLIQQTIERILDEVLPGVKFNPNSPKQKAILFYDIFGCKKIYKRGSTLTTDKDALEKIKIRDKREFVQVLAETCLRYRAAAAMAGKLKTPLRRGRIHTKYGLGGIDQLSSEVRGKEEGLGTETGRLNSQASDILNIFDPNKNKYVSSGTNLQNLKEGPQREMVIPEEGEEFCHVDLYAAEAYLVALDAGEDSLLAMLDKGEKIHDWLLNWIKEKFPEEVAKVDFNYKNAKQCVHALNYGLHPKMMEVHTKLPIAACEIIYNFYHTTFPGIHMRMVNIEQQIKKTWCLTSLLGRKRYFFAPMSEELLKQAYAWPSQSVIGEITIMALTRIYQMGQRNIRLKEHRLFPALNTHDGLVIRVPKDDRKAIEKYIINAFNIPLTQEDKTIRIPIEIGWGRNFNEVLDKKVVRYD